MLKQIWSPETFRASKEKQKEDDSESKSARGHKYGEGRIASVEEVKVILKDSLSQK